MTRRVIRVGDVFGKWTVAGDRLPGSLWPCRCTCGRDALVETGNLNGGYSTQCRSCASRIHPRRRIAMHLSTKLFGRLAHAARNATRRCTIQTHPQWGYYGGRGICVYPEWIAEPEKFVAYLATLEGHDDESLVLDRINNDGNYEPGNLRYTTRSVSVRNTRKRVCKPRKRSAANA